MDDQEEKPSDLGGRRSWTDEMGSPIDAVRRVALAGLGAIAVATEATDDIFHSLVKKGEETREEASREIRAARLRGVERRTDSTTFLRTRMDSALSRVNLASKSDIEALNAKLSIISRKIDQVSSSKRAGTRGPSSVETESAPNDIDLMTGSDPTEPSPQ